jgi:hypothetical protein
VDRRSVLPSVSSDLYFELLSRSFIRVCIPSGGARRCFGIVDFEVSPSDYNEWICNTAEKVTGGTKLILLSDTLSNTNRGHGTFP